MRETVAEVANKGNATRGEALYRRKDLSCLKCHAIAGAGGQVGPDLSSIGASAQVDYLVDSLLQPNKAVKEGYHATLVTTKAGKLFTGIKLKQTSTEDVLRGADDAEITIPTRDIEEQTLAGSLMPDGLTDTLTRSEFADLVRFLSELGKVGNYSVSKARLVRRWQVLEATPATTEAVRAGGLVGAIQDGQLIWSPAYSTVAGALPVSDLPGVGPAKLGVVRCQLGCHGRRAGVAAVERRQGIDPVAGPNAGGGERGYGGESSARHAHPDVCHRPTFTRRRSAGRIGRRAGVAGTRPRSGWQVSNTR